MAWPADDLAADKTDETPTPADDHAGHHNALAAALNQLRTVPALAGILSVVTDDDTWWGDPGLGVEGGDGAESFMVQMRRGDWDGGSITGDGGLVNIIMEDDYYALSIITFVGGAMAHEVSLRVDSQGPTLEMSHDDGGYVKLSAGANGSGLNIDGTNPIAVDSTTDPDSLRFNGGDAPWVFGSAFPPAPTESVTGARDDGDSALANLLNALALKGLIVNDTTST